MDKDKRSNRKKQDQLGMPGGTASGKLRKLILFDLLQQLGLDTCYRCNEQITSAEELSIEHKEPWLDSDDPVAKFFDLNNIGFSHLVCNVRAARRANKIIPPAGMCWCIKCKTFKPLGEFAPSRRTRRNICRTCHTKRIYEYRKRTGKH